MSVQAVDLFCGIGGLTRGLLNAGINVVAGFDNDITCRYAYKINNKADFFCADMRKVRGSDVIKCYSNRAVRVLVGCAPCQPFSSMRFKMHTKNALDERYNLLSEFARIIKTVKPTIISMENVPKIEKVGVYKEFISLLSQEGYHVSAGVVFCPDYGVPQTRRRFVLLASKLGKIKMIKPTTNRNEVVIENFIKALPPIKAGDICDTDYLHRSAKLSKLNLRRIEKSIPGGSWRDWPEELRCECHKKDTGQTYSSVYGRLKWGQIGPTITTQFYCYGTGRYGHPDQNRALSLREGSLLQTFPSNYEFAKFDEKFSFRDVARHIGNAVPVKLGEAIGTSIMIHLQQYNIK